MEMGINKIIGLTGTPGTGKKTIGNTLSKIIGFGYLELNKFASQSGAIIGKDEDSFIADPKILRSHVMKITKSGNFIVAGHLLSSVFNRTEIDRVFVLRCSPIELEKRLLKRKYSKDKIKRNVQAEILDVCLYEAIKKFGPKKVIEVDTTDKRPLSVAKKIIKLIKTGSYSSAGLVNWISFLIKNGSWEKFLSL